ncbi:vacuolar protein sorting-associated protein 18 [Schistosoma bovis]|uniref:Vacuolar protein sorting-associated protein 18 homolog n=1 Tax=Schistosoma bovis TaxID=6184 RepID=A0A430Q2S4_SCHBO|nr:vacuolar protein sorting-associated protein 18 [Schistosoma bovis]
MCSLCYNTLSSKYCTSGISNAINAYTGGHRSSLVNEYNQQQSVGIQNTTIFPIITGLFSSVFNSDDKLPVGSKVTEFPGSFGYSDLKLYRNVKDELPSKFAWMTGPGVYFGYIRTEQLSMPPFTKLSTNDQPIDVKSFPNEVVSLLPTATDNTDDPNRPKDIFSGRGVNLTRNTKLIPYPIIHMLERPGVPLGICLTEFHLIIIYVDRIKAVNTLDGRADPGQMDTINIREAEYNFDNENYGLAAKLFARSSIPFEQIALRFFRLSSSSSSSTSTTHTIDLSSTIIPSTLIQQGYEINDDHDIMEALIIQSKQQYPINDKLTGLIDSSIKQCKSFITSIHSYSSTLTPLKIFLSSKLDYLIEQNNQIISNINKQSVVNLSGQIILLAIWLIELLITELSVIRDRLKMITKLDHNNDDLDEIVNDNDQNNKMISDGNVTVNNNDNCDDKVKLTLQNRLASNFLPEAKSLIYDLLENHGENDELVYFMELMKDYPRLVDHYMRQCMYSDALKILATYPNCLNRLYDHASSLASKCPEEFVNVCLRLNNKLDINRLLPSIMLLPNNYAINYLEDTIGIYTNKNISNQAVHHMLISLYANEYHLNHNDDRLMKYLEKFSIQAIHIRRLKQQHQQNIVDNGDLFNDYQLMNMDLTELSLLEHDNDTVNDCSTVLPYDPGYVLRLCKEVDHLKGVLYILQLLDMHQEALQLAIELIKSDMCMIFITNEAQLGCTSISPKLYKLVTSLVMRSPIFKSLDQHFTTRMSVSPSSAQHIISTDGSMQEAINLLRDCPLLKLEDILPYFHQFVTIDQFKDVICSSLDSYNERIDNVKNEIQSTMKTIDELRTQSNNLRYRYEIIENDSRCTHCNHLLTLRAFYVFPCGHNFHISCLTELVKPYLSAEEKSQLSKVVESQNLGNNPSVTNVEVSYSTDFIAT